MTLHVVDTDTGELVSRSLADCEAVIERGLNTFVEVGAALMEIRDARLYRASHGDFDTYCAERWGMKRAHAYRLIESSEIVGALSPIGDTPTPETESQARALAPLKDDPDAMAEVMAEVAEEADKVTARAIGNKVAEGDYVYQRTSACRWDDVLAGRTVRSDNVTAAQQKLDTYDENIEVLRPLMESSGLTVGQAIKKLAVAS